MIFIQDEMNLPLTEDIQLTFIDFTKYSIRSHVDYLPKAKQGRCHIYSNPCSMKYYNIISNHFPGGSFQSVRAVSLVDEHLFEDEFFLRIAQSFPLMEELSVMNYKAQQKKESSQSKHSPIKYSYLHQLRLIDAHDGYIEQFLSHTKTSLEKNFILYIKYQSLQRVTNNFIRDQTRINSKKITHLYLCSEYLCSISSLREYFPSALISRKYLF